MFVHISPEPEALGETISTLKFAERVSTIELGAARANKESGEVKELKEQVLTSYLFFYFGDFVAYFLWN
jgi:kinesin family protein C2/C3